MNKVNVRQKVELKGQKHTTISDNTCYRLRKHGMLGESFYGLVNRLLDDIKGKPVTKTMK